MATERLATCRRSNAICNTKIIYNFNSNINSQLKEIDGPVITGVTQPIEPTLIYSKQKSVYLNINTWEGLPTWVSEDAKRAIFRSISNAIATNILQVTAPVIVATQLKMSLGTLHEVQTVVLRAMPRFQGIVAHDCVKVWLDEENNEGATRKSVYFGKCMVFLQDSEGKQFVVIQWFTRHEENGFDKISKVPSFKLAPETNTKSYSTLPLAAILNGALMVPGRGRFWALLAPKEQKLYARLFE